MERETGVKRLVCSQTAIEQKNSDYNQLLTARCSEFNQPQSSFFSMAYLRALADSCVRETLLNLQEQMHHCQRQEGLYLRWERVPPYPTPTQLGVCFPLCLTQEEVDLV